MSDITTSEHGPYQIKAAKIGKEYLARAFPKPAAKTKGLVAKASGSSVEDAIETLKARLDENLATRESQRRWYEEMHFHVPLEEEYVTALRQTQLSEKEKQILAVHAAAGEEGLTEAGMAKAAGHIRFQTAIVQYGKLGRKLGKAINISAPKPSGRQSESPSAILSREEVDPETGDVVWVMHPELRSAVEVVLT